MVRTIFTDETMELEVGYIPSNENNKAKVLLLLSPVDKDDIALNNTMELEAVSYTHLTLPTKRIV